MAEKSEEDGASGGLTAPYTAFSSVKTAARTMKEHGIPSRIDRSVLTNFSGSVASQIMQAFKFLGLTTENGQPTKELRALIEAADNEERWATTLAHILRRAYEPMFALDLETASPSQFVQHFRKNYPGAENVSRKSLTFFVNALQDAKIPVSTYILKNKKPRSGGAKKRITKPQIAKRYAQPSEFVDDESGETLMLRNDKPSERLLDLLDPSEMGHEEQTAVWTLIKFFKTKGQ